MKSHLILLILVVLALKTVEEKLLDVTSEDQLSFIKINVLLNTSPRIVSAQLQTAVPQGHLGERQVYNWYNDFKQGKRTKQMLPICPYLEDHEKWQLKKIRKLSDSSFWRARGWELKIYFGKLDLRKLAY